MLAIAILTVVGVIAIMFVLLRRDSLAPTIETPPAWGSPEAARLRQDIVLRGPSHLIGQRGGGSRRLATVPPPRDERDFFSLIYGDAKPRTSIGVVWRRWRCQPVRPKPLRAPSVVIEPAPPEWTIVLADRCRICNRILTHPTSMERGVGPDCYANYGAHVVRTPNPNYGEWLGRRALMDKERSAWQALLDEVYRLAMERYAVETRNWQAAVDLARSPLAADR